LLVQHFKVKFVVPPCARESVVSLRESTIDIAVEIPMSGHCYSAAHTETMEATVGVSRGSPVPSYIGLVRGTARSGPDFLDYFDGVEHTTRL
jgi:hypothetical protein